MKKKMPAKFVSNSEKKRSKKCRNLTRFRKFNDYYTKKCSANGKGIFWNSEKFLKSDTRWIMKISNITSFIAIILLKVHQNLDQSIFIHFFVNIPCQFCNKILSLSYSIPGVRSIGGLEVDFSNSWRNPKFTHEQGRAEDVPLRSDECKLV